MNYHTAPRSPLDTPCTIRPGDRFGRWTVLGQPFAIRSLPCGKRQAALVCRCDCGTVAVVRANHLRGVADPSCGCHTRELTSARQTTHGMSDTRLYRIWHGMLRRCANPTVKAFRYYGGRGIAVCQEWHDFATFHNWAITAEYEPHLILDRRDSDQGYSPTNCRWVTRAENNRNRRYCRLTMPLAALARLAVAFGVPKREIVTALKCTPRTLDQALRGDTWADMPAAPILADATPRRSRDAQSQAAV